ncbi:hypothetical protein BC332_09875 [Capsicum chinense]|uniref:Uncharacterized protein n=1 Tax=Capsicum annuum TaxID=4072 RepID=A0A2G3A3S7_CAPAN|nr:hypothetical protein T459_10993 [Capsicum annuum]PHU24768.1 hypothetical protein BC332_09875 [Capsicum chinense]
MNGVLKVPHTLQTAKVVFRHTAIRSVGKAANRSAVHGTKLPIPDIVDKEQVEVDINQAREVMEKKRRELENALDSQLKNWNVIRFSN